MAKIFSFASWNVEHFNGRYERVRDCIQFINAANPDVFAIFEVEGKYVFSDFVELMPTHNFFITEDMGQMEILVGVNRSLVAFITQRNQFKSDLPTLRPGVLATLTIADQHYSLLFLHMKSMPDPRSWGLRDDMIIHVRGLKNALDSAAGGPANFICMGDFNTMGMNLTYSDKDVSAAEELARYEKILAWQQMKLLAKEHSHTWWNGNDQPGPSNLDHVFASEQLNFQKFGAADIAVKGWPAFDDPAQARQWISQFSDHAMLYGEVIE